MPLTKEALLTAADDRPIAVTVPVYGTVWIRPLSVDDVDEVEHRLGAKRPYSAFIICRGLVTEHGQRIFDDADEAAVGRKLGKQARFLAGPILDHSTLAGDDLRQLEKNLPPIESDKPG